MELKWLEDFVSVAEKGHFARAAAERLITQSALSRRIQSLEAWVGAKLLDRSEHPIKLTAAGREYMKYAKDIISQSYEGRAVTSRFAKIDASNITIACLHTLALSYVPSFVKNLQDKIGTFSTTIIADTSTFEEYLTGLYDGSNDLFICYSNPAFTLGINETEFPRKLIGRHWVHPYASLTQPDISLSSNSRKPIPYVQYSAHTYMTRVVEQTIKRAPFRDRLNTVYRASIAESLMTATQKGLGVSWLPNAIVGDYPEEKGLRQLSDEWSSPLDIYIYRSVKNPNTAVLKIWELLEPETTGHSRK